MNMNKKYFLLSLIFLASLSYDSFAGHFDNFNLMMKRSAVGETIAHLEYLVAHNSLDKINGGHKQVVWSLP